MSNSTELAEAVPIDKSNRATSSLFVGEIIIEYHERTQTKTHRVGGNRKRNQQSTNADKNRQKQCFRLPFVASGATNGYRKHFFY